MVFKKIRKNRIAPLLKKHIEIPCISLRTMITLINGNYIFVICIY